MRPRVANAAWLAASRPHRERFLRGAPRAAAVQERLLARLLAANADTEFGRAHGFRHVTDLQAYRRRVPVRTHEDFAPWIDEAAAGRPGVLTAEPVRLFEPTGGSTGGSKLIPYTRALHREFRRAIAAWVADIFTTLPAALDGASYWSVSPPAPAAGRTPGGIPIGFADDVEYLGGAARFVRHAMAVPASLARIADADRFMDATALALLRRSDLAIVSVWNPSFLLLLLERMRSPALLRALGAGDPPRARFVEKVLGAGGPPAGLWPRLQLVSCWADAAARPFAGQLAREFPGVVLQPKGLLATEGFVTLPLFAAGGCVPAYRSHVLEFVGDDGACHGPAELAPGAEYAVVLSTGGGLYRYALGDRVRVAGRHAGLPVLEFTGRERTSDLVGEKLDDRHAQAALETALAGAGVAPSFAMLAPEAGLRSAGYVLFVEAGDLDPARAGRLAQALERGLARNVQYAHARRLGQLEPLRVFRVERGGQAAFLRRSVAEGQSLGDVKPAALDRRTGWTACFEGAMVSAHDPPAPCRREEEET